MCCNEGELSFLASFLASSEAILYTALTVTRGVIMMKIRVIIALVAVAEATAKPVYGTGNVLK